MVYCEFCYDNEHSAHKEDEEEGDLVLDRARYKLYSNYLISELQIQIDLLKNNKEDLERIQESKRMIDA